MYIYPNNSVKMSQPSYKGIPTAGKTAVKSSGEEMFNSLGVFTREKLALYSGKELIQAIEYIQKLIKTPEVMIKKSLKIKKQKSPGKNVKKELAEFIRSVKQRLNKSSGQEIHKTLQSFKQNLPEDCSERELIEYIDVIKRMLTQSSKQDLANSQRQLLVLLKQVLTKLTEPKLTQYSEQKFSKEGLNEYLSNWDYYYKNGFTKRFRTCNLLNERLNMTYEEYNDYAERVKGKKIYNEIIKRCNQDIENAILSNESKTTISALFDTLNLFIYKFSHYNK